LRRLAGLAIAGFVLTVFAVILIKDGRRLLAYSFRLDPLLVLLAFVIECSGLALAVPVWHQILGRFGSRLGYRDDLRIYCYSLLAGLLPGGIWPMASRAALYDRLGLAGTRVAVASVVESVLMSLAGLIVYGLSGTATLAESFWQRPIIALAIAALAAVWIQPPVFNRVVGWLFHRSRQTDEGLISLRYADLALWLVLEAVVVVIGGAAVYVLLCSFTTVSPGLFFTVVNAWALSVAAGSLFFWMPGTLVIRDGAMTFILAGSLPVSVAVLFVLIVRVLNSASILIVAALAWFLLGRSSPRGLPS